MCFKHSTKHSLGTNPSFFPATYGVAHFVKTGAQFLAGTTRIFDFSLSTVTGIEVGIKVIFTRMFAGSCFTACTLSSRTGSMH